MTQSLASMSLPWEDMHYFDGYRLTMDIDTEDSEVIRINIEDGYWVGRRNATPLSEDTTDDDNEIRFVYDMKRVPKDEYDRYEHIAQDVELPAS